MDTFCPVGPVVALGLIRRTSTSSAASTAMCARTDRPPRWSSTPPISSPTRASASMLEPGDIFATQAPRRRRAARRGRSALEIEAPEIGMLTPPWRPRASDPASTLTAHRCEAPCAHGIHVRGQAVRRRRRGQRLGASWRHSGGARRTERPRPRRRPRQFGGYPNLLRRGQYRFDPSLHYIGECGPGQLLTTACWSRRSSRAPSASASSPRRLRANRSSPATRSPCPAGSTSTASASRTDFPHEREGL